MSTGSSDFDTTPKKRKRLSGNDYSLSSLAHGSSKKCYENSVAINVDNKENLFIYNPFMETKSIAELLENRVPENPYEVVRKPPKKKKKHEIEECCFTNPGLNLNGPEIPVNPFEIKREIITNADQYCFRNPCLNINAVEHGTTNPFEVRRDENLSCDKGVENPSMDMQETRAIGLPFTPTVGCRIDFSNVPLESLTPCAYLNKALVLTPEKMPPTPSRSLAINQLPIIKEETVDIDEELDCYQLELENSINENKSLERKTKKQSNDIKNTSSNSIEYEEFNDLDPKDDSFQEFKNPFVRTYRRSVRKNVSETKSNSSVNSKDKPNFGIRRSIRQSIRRIMNPEKNAEPKTLPVAKDDKHSDNIFSTIRQSLRRKPKNPTIPPKIVSHNTSILIENERKIYKQITGEKSDDGNFARKTLRASIRRTTKGVLKTVFKKKSEDFCLD